MQDLDVARLDCYLRTHIDVCPAPLQLARLEGGQSNPTYRLTCADGTRLVLRKQGIMKRAQGGNAASAEAFETGARARPIAQAAWRQVTEHFITAAR